MSTVFKEKIGKTVSIIPEIYDNITEVGVNDDFSSYIISNKKIYTVGCLKCNNPRCIYFGKYDVLKINNISLEENLHVCPTNAINIDNKSGYPKIDETKCIKCGLCIRRCPINAIYLDKENNITINKFINCNITLSNVSVVDKQINFIKWRIKNKSFIKNTNIKKYVELVYNKIYKYSNYTSPNFCNHLVKNILLELGYKVNMTRIGDVYNRMDGLLKYKHSSLIVPIEIEFGQEYLHNVRMILDDIAMLNYKYNINTKDASPLIFLLELPNKRTNYWQDIEDIEKVTEYKINTVTLGVLLSNIAIDKQINLESDCYYLKVNNNHIEENAFNSRYSIFRIKK